MSEDRVVGWRKWLDTGLALSDREVNEFRMPVELEAIARDYLRRRVICEQVLKVASHGRTPFARKTMFLIDTVLLKRLYQVSERIGGRSLGSVRVKLDDGIKQEANFLAASDEEVEDWFNDWCLSITKRLRRLASLRAFRKDARKIGIGKLMYEMELALDQVEKLCNRVLSREED